MLCVTITIVYSLLKSVINSSILSVAIGSSAEQGSSISSTSGLTAKARAIHRRHSQRLIWGTGLGAGTPYQRAGAGVQRPLTYRRYSRRPGLPHPRYAYQE